MPFQDIVCPNADQSSVRLNGRSPMLYRIVCEQFFRINLIQVDPKLL